MNGHDSFRAVEYGSGEGQEAVALVTGFAGNVRQLDKAASDLSALGRDVVVYDYSPQVLLEGDSGLLPQLIDTLYGDFQERTSGHERKRFGGVSLGGAIASGMQKQHPSPEPGLFAATGADAARLIMRNGLFNAIVKRFHGVDIRKTYRANGYTMEDLQALWQDINQPPDTAFSITLGSMDYIIPIRRMKRTIAGWKSNNPDIQSRYLPHRGHNGTIRWFNEHCAELIERAA